MAEIIIQDSLIARKRLGANKALSDRVYDIESKIRKIGKIYRKNVSGLLETLSTGLAIQGAVQEELEKRLTEDNKYQFSSFFSYWVCKDYILSRINGNQSGGINFYSESSLIDFETARPNPVDVILERYSKGLDEATGTSQLEKITSDLFHHIDGMMQKKAAEPRFSELNLFLKKNSLVVLGRKYKGLFVKVGEKENKQKTFDDFGGYDEAKNYFKDLKLIIDNMEEALLCMPIDELLPKGTLLVGPPGTGKTTLAQIFCYEVGIPYEEFGVADIGSSFQYETPKRLQEKCESAAKYIRENYAPAALLCIDEIDSIAKKRYSDNSGGDKNLVVNTLNIHMCGPKAVPGVMFLGTTNRPDQIDAAILRPGRFSQIITMGYPDDATIKAIFEAQIRQSERYSSKNLFTDVDYTALMQACSNKDRTLDPMYLMSNEEVYDGGFTGAVINELVIRTKRQNLLEHLKIGQPMKPVSTEDILQQIKAYNESRK